MEQRINELLTEAAQEGNINTLYALIREDPFLLVRIDQVPFVHTPLHTAAAAGRMQFAMEMMNLKPSFARKLNQDGFSPMHLALQHGHAEIVHRFVEINRDLVRVKGREGITPLHYVAAKGDLNLLAEFLSTCEESIKDLTIRNETAMHIAVKNIKFKALKVLVGCLLRTVDKDAGSWEKKLLNWKDDEGNTVLHIATSRDQPQVVRLLIKRSVNTNAKNLEGLTALDIVESHTQLDNREVIRDLLWRAGALEASSLPSVTSPTDYFRSKRSFWEKFELFSTRRRMHLSSETGNLLVVVAVLIVTTTYQAVLSPPGGVWQDDYNPPILINTTHRVINTKSTLSEGSERPHLAGKSVMTENEWGVFVACNTTALLYSIGMICVLFPRVPGGRTLLPVSLVLLLCCYFVSVSVIKPNEVDVLTKWILGVIIFFVSFGMLIFSFAGIVQCLFSRMKY